MTLSPIFFLASVPTFPSQPLASALEGPLPHLGGLPPSAPLPPARGPEPTPCQAILGATSQLIPKMDKGKRFFWILYFVTGTSTPGTHRARA